MGLFGKKQAQLDRAPLTISLDAYPAASPDDRESMATILAAIDQKRGKGEFTPQQVAAIGTLCERLVQGNPALGGFVTELRTAVEHESRLRGDSSVSWRSMARHL